MFLFALSHQRRVRQSEWQCPREGAEDLQRVSLKHESTESRDLSRWITLEKAPDRKSREREREREKLSYLHDELEHVHYRNPERVHDENALLFDER